MRTNAAIDGTVSAATGRIRGPSELRRTAPPEGVGAAGGARRRRSLVVGRRSRVRGRWVEGRGSAATSSA